MLDDAFAAFGQVPEFFAALGSEGVTTLEGARAVLDRMGAADETPREREASRREGPG